MKDVYRIRIRKVYASFPGWPSGGPWELSSQTKIYAILNRLQLPTNKWRSAGPGRSLYLLSITGLGVGSTTVCPVHNFPPLSELLVCYQPHRNKVMPGQKSIYETFLVLSIRCRGSLRDDLRGLRICNAASLQYNALTRFTHILSVSLALIQIYCTVLY